MFKGSFHIEPSADTPGVRFDKDDAVLEIFGRSLPENAYSFYEQFITWAESFEPSILSQNLVVRFRLDYFNSSSSRYILELMATLEKRYSDKKAVHIEWYVDPEDELMIEKGEEYGHLLEFPLKILYT
jgi:hypothetical protein